MFTSIRNLWGALGVMLALIALYLVLEFGTEASQVISAVGKSTGDIFAILQGRNPGNLGTAARGTAGTTARFV